MFAYLSHWPLDIDIIIKSPDVCRKALSLLLYQSSSPCSGRPSNLHQTFVRRLISIFPLSIFAQHFPRLLFQGWKVRKSASIFDTTSFSHPHFKNQETYQYQSVYLGGAMINLCSPQILCSLVHLQGAAIKKTLLCKMHYRCSDSELSCRIFRHCSLNNFPSVVFLKILFTSVLLI